MPSFECLTQVSQRFEAAARDDPVFSTADPNEVIRSIPNNRMILRGFLGARPAVFRVFLDNPEVCKLEWAELERIWPHMKSGDFQVCTPLACSAEQGVMAVSDVRGMPLLQWMYEAPKHARANWLPNVAQWHRTYCAPTTAQTAADPDRWIARARNGAEQQVFNRLRRVEQKILQEVQKLGAQLRGLSWRSAISHGDMHPNNLIARDTTLTGIDCGGSHPAPIYKDMARFLMHMGRRGMIPSGQRYLGVDAHGLTAFGDAFELSEFERSVTLPFFVGVEALIRAETRSLPSSRIRRAKEMSEVLLEDLRERNASLPKT